MKVLIMGFEPYDGDINASQVLVHSLSQKLTENCQGATIHFGILPCDTQKLNRELTSLIHDITPHTCLYIGQAPGRNKITLERVALNLKDFPCPDNAGNQPRGEKIAEDGPVAYWASLPHIDGTIAAINQAGIPATTSNHAGSYLCNQALYLALHLAHVNRLNMQSGFLHIPLLPEQVHKQHANSPFMPLAMSEKAVQIILERLLS